MSHGVEFQVLQEISSIRDISPLSTLIARAVRSSGTLFCVLVVDSLDSLSAVSTPACLVLNDFAERVRFTSHGPYAHDRFFFVPIPRFVGRVEGICNVGIGLTLV